MLTVLILCAIFPGMGPRGPATDRAQKIRAFLGAVPILLVILTTIGGIYSGLFLPTEAAGIGAAMVIVYGLLTGALDWRSFWRRRAAAR